MTSIPTTVTATSRAVGTTTCGVPVVAVLRNLVSVFVGVFVDVVVGEDLLQILLVELLALTCLPSSSTEVTELVSTSTTARS